MYRAFVRVRVIAFTLTFTLTSTLTFWASLTSYLLHLTSYHSPLTPKKVRVEVRVNRSTLTCLQPFVYRALRAVW